MANKMTKDQMEQMCENARRLGFRPERLRLLDERLQCWSKNEMTPSIAVKVLRHGEMAFEGAYGILGPDKEGDSLRVDTIFPICSMTKPVVSTLLALMQEEGLIDLNDPVRNYLPEFTGDKDSEIRIWHLITHTSGIIDGDFYNGYERFVKENISTELPSEDNQEAWDVITLKIREKLGLPTVELGNKMRHETYLAAALTQEPTHKPHAVMTYCNTGFHLVMSIINKISGKPIDVYAKEKLFDPLKMIDSHFLFPKEKRSRFIQRGAEYVGSDWLNEDILSSEHGPGGLKSTVHDMTRFGQMYLNKGYLDGVSVLSPASIRELTFDQNFIISEATFVDRLCDMSWNTWGLGWNLRGRKRDDAGLLRSPASYEHGGFGCCKLLCDPEADVVAAYFTVCKTDTNYKASAFNNIVLGAITNLKA